MSDDVLNIATNSAGWLMHGTDEARVTVIDGVRGVDIDDSELGMACGVAEASVPGALTGRWVEAGADRTANEVRQLLQFAIAETLGEDANRWIWVRDHSATFVVYEVEGTGPVGMWQADYTIDDGGVVTLGDPVAVEERSKYTPIGQATEGVTAWSNDRIGGRVIEARENDATSGGRVFRVQIIAYGDSLNGRRYPESVMRKAAPMYEGAKAYDHHRTLEELNTSTIDGLVGTYRNIEATASGIEADLVLLPSAHHTAEALDLSLSQQADGKPDLVGISHDVYAAYKPIQAAGRQLMEATDITKVNSADVVADPAAGGRVTRMVAGGPGSPDPQEGPAMKTLKELLELLRGATPEKVTELLTEHAAVLEASGITADQATALAIDTGGTQTPPEPKVDEPVVAGATEAKYTKDGMVGSMLIERAVASVATDAELQAKLVGVLTQGLPVSFTEAELTTAVDGLKAQTRLLEAAGLTPSVPDARVTQEAQEKKVAALDAMFAGDFREGYRSLRTAYRDVMGIRGGTDDIDPQDLLRECLGFASWRSGTRGTESLDSASWGQILGDSVTRRMVAEYSEASLEAWRSIVSSTVPVTDFREQKITRMGGYGSLPTVAQGAPYQPLDSPTDEEATYSIGKKGGTEDLTFEMIANDDIRSIVRIPKAMGRAAAITIYREVFELLAANATSTYDATALFHASHSNTATGSALTQSTLSAARKAMRQQTAYGNAQDQLSFVPKLLLVPADLEEMAFQLANSAVAIPATPAGPSNTPNIHQGIQPIVVDYWTDANDWFVVADPAQCPTIEVGFFQGKEQPELFVQDDPKAGAAFTSDKVTYKIRFIYGLTVLDHRGFQRRQG